MHYAITTPALVAGVALDCETIGDDFELYLDWAEHQFGTVERVQEGAYLYVFGTAQVALTSELTFEPLSNYNLDLFPGRPGFNADALDSLRRDASSLEEMLHVHRMELTSARSEIKYETARAARDLIRALFAHLTDEEEELVRGHWCGTVPEEELTYRLIRVICCLMDLHRRNVRIQFVLAEKKAGRQLDPDEVEITEP